ncbi:DUF1266 domain-containing protein [Myroides sp. LJL119]
MDKDVSLPQDKYQALLKGSINALEQGANLNSLQTGLTSNKVTTLLVEWWGIHDTDEALQTLDTIANTGSSYYFDTVYKAFLLGDQDEGEHLLRKAYHQDQTGLNKSFSLWENLLATFKELEKLHVVSNVQEIQKLGVEAWDVGRVIFIARLCLDANYLTQQQAWQYITQVSDKANSKFSNWKDFAYSYILGRAMWGGSDANLSHTLKLVESLLNDSQSPWVKNPW